MEGISGCLTPSIPAFTGAGLLKILLLILTMTNILSTESSTYVVLNFTSNAAEYIKFAANDKVGYYPKRYGIDFYHTYKEDLKLLKDLGLKAFRTSICWARIFPAGDEEKPIKKVADFLIHMLCQN